MSLRFTLLDKAHYINIDLVCSEKNLYPQHNPTYSFFSPPHGRLALHLLLCSARMCRIQIIEEPGWDCKHFISRSRWPLFRG